MTALTTVVLPVFIVIGFGYLSAWRGWFPESGVAGLIKFTQGFAIPCLLFRAISTLDLGQSFDVATLGSFYAGAILGFVVGMVGARLLFGREWEDCVAIGFVGLFSNSLLLGLPITERAYGADALEPNYAIIAIHAPLCYGIGITVMELVRARGQRLASLPRTVLTAMFRNALVIGITLGFVVNLTGLPLPGVLDEAIDLMVSAALPAALFGLGAVLFRYRPEGDMRVILFITTVSLVMHPLVTWSLGLWAGLDVGAERSAVLTAAMAPGVNAYLFADMYGRARRVAASAVLIGTAASVITATLWIVVLP